MLTWIELNKNAFEHNISWYKRVLSPTTLFVPVIKSNAYGHGLHHIAQLCQTNPHVDWLCVVSLTEAITLRANGITKPLIVLSIIDDDIEHAVTNAIDLTIYTFDQAQQLSACAVHHGTTAYVHIKIDTGLTRLGALHTHAVPFIQQIAALPNICIRGIYSHLANSEDEDQTYAHVQRTRLETVYNASIKYLGYKPLMHISCSAALTSHDLRAYSLARAGIGIYGLWPSPENKQITHIRYPRFNLQPVLTWKTRIINIKRVAAGTPVGYGCTHITSTERTIAVVPIGYYDGYDRALSNCGYMYIGDSKIPVVGRVAMNLTMIDVTSVNHAAVGTIVTVLGTQPGITADDMARTINTINYEIVTRIGSHIPRKIIEKSV